MVYANYNNWIEESASLLGDNLYGIYKIGTFETLAFKDHSDIDLIYVLSDPLSPELQKKYKILYQLWRARIPLDVHFILRSQLGFSLENQDAYLISCCLAWQGKCVKGTPLSLQAPDEKITYIFHGLKILKSLMKSQKEEVDKLNKAIFYAIQVLDKNISWENADTKSNLLKFTPPQTWNLETAKKVCLEKISEWKLPESLKTELSSFL